jgi:hypothetical protein
MLTLMALMLSSDRPAQLAPVRDLRHHFEWTSNGKGRRATRRDKLGLVAITVWPTGLASGGVKPNQIKTRFSVNLACPLILIKGRSICVAYGLYLRGCIMPCEASQNVAIVMPAWVYRAGEHWQAPLPTHIPSPFTVLADCVNLL